LAAAPRSFDYDDLRLCSSRASGTDPLDVCIAKASGELGRLADEMLRILERPPPVRRADLLPLGGSGISPCKTHIEHVQVQGQVRAIRDLDQWRCAVAIDSVYGKVSNSTWLRGLWNWRSARRDLAWAVSRIGQLLPWARERLIVVASATDLTLLRRACGIDRLEYCFAVLHVSSLRRNSSGANTPASLSLQRAIAIVLAQCLLQVNSHPVFANTAYIRAARMAPDIVSVSTQWYEKVCGARGPVCDQTMCIISRLCFVEALQGPAMREACMWAFAVFAL